MKAVILAGGQGTRLAPVTHGLLPKPMAELCGRPVLEHIVALLRENGFTELCCALACMPEVIRDHFGDGRRFGVSMEYRLESCPLGTAGAVRNCRDFFGDEPFLVISGDAACDFPLRTLYDKHRDGGSPVTMALYPQETPLPYGLVVTDPEGRVCRFIEKPRWEQVVTDLVNTGIYVLEPRVLDRVPEGRPFDFAKDLFPLLLREGKTLTGLPMRGYWRDIGDPVSYYRANLDAAEGRLRLYTGSGARPEPAAPAKEPPSPYACRLLVETPHRARLMRELGRSLMSSGARFENGLTLPSVPGGMHIAPCAGRGALRVESDDPLTARRFQAMAQNIENGYLS